MYIHITTHIVISIFFLSRFVLALDRARVYMESSCGETDTFTTSYQLDLSTGLTYLNQQDCTYSVTAPTGYFVVAVITRFELEPKLTGTCVDYLDAYDGADKTAPKLNSDPICGSGTSIPGNLTASGESLTLHFVTDNNGLYLGFSINFVAATYGPCSTSQYACNTSICIDSSLECDAVNQCGDSSDEDNCPETSDSESLNIMMIVIIVLIVVLVIGAAVAYIAYRIHARNQWKKFLHAHIDDDDGIVEPGPSYPITHRYYNGIRGHPNVYSNNIILSSEQTQIQNKAEKEKVSFESEVSEIPSVSSK